jgi:hypothetical protein
MLIVGSYFCFRLIKPGLMSRRRILFASVLIVVAGTLLAAIQILPTSEYITLGHRQPQPFAALTAGLDGSGFLTLWLPGFFGDITRSWWGKLNYNELIVYAGLTALILTALAVMWRRDGLTIFFTLLAVFGAACAAGTASYQLLAWLPGFNSLTPMRMRF